MGGEKLEKIIEAARMYYQLDYSQQDIARKLGVSRPTVSRFLQQAKTEGIVQIKIMDPTENSGMIAQQLEEKYGLQKVIVAPIPLYEDRVAKKYLGEAAAEYLHQIVKDGDTIAVTWGTTLYEIAKRLQNKHVKDVNIVQLNGGISYSETNTHASEIVYLFGKAYHTNPHLLPLPAIVDHTVVKQAIEADRHIRKVLDMGKNANIAVFTIGVPTEDSVLVRTNYFSKEELEMIQERCVGDICSRFIDIKGDICNEELDGRTIGIDLAELRSKEKSILVAGGAKKVDAIFGALQGKYTNVLITDQFTATSLLDYQA
ncbi:sugar-binding transcriptional regulator [Paenibacillus sp. MSJ-34]|uniref:sugar-binding transcriptional regulator n=1 Tax=Paenibacillus sp. MSJ-34 TaxID=2841529 RepID=UPI001C10257F|nr:sugar-binding transcriptional regulator [Paenibacillus sp. MSJ-34]MBU5441252.1 sugar-binding transcriptional regulator [Paenibacillus sp. MSJ-34]